MDIPTGEYSIIPTFILSEYARRHVGVVFSGDGADELFGGYLTYTADVFANFFMKLPEKSKKIMSSAVKLLPVQYSWMNFRYKAELFLKGISNVDHIPHYTWREIFSDEEKKKLYPKSFFEQLEKSFYFKEPYLLFDSYFNKFKSYNLLEKALFFDTKVWLPDGVLNKVNMATTFHSLETRIPFLSNKLLDFACTLPLHKKINILRRKYLLKKAFSNDLPKSIISRSKQGLSVPISKWLRYDLKDFVLERFNNTSKEVNEIVSQKYVRMLLDRHIKGEEDFGRKLWNILMFFIWFDNFKRDSNSLVSNYDKDNFLH